MEGVQVAEIITNVGFPITAVIFMAVYLKSLIKDSREDSKALINDIRTDSKEREEHYRVHQEKMVGELGKISETIVRINDRLDNIEEKVYDKE